MERYYPDLAQLVIALEVEVPRIWRRVHVSAFCKLGGLHRVIQAVMGWDNRQPHRFVLAGDFYDRVEPGQALDATRERNWRLDSALYPDKLFWYVYGHEDPWLHRIVFEGYVGGNPHWRYPRCVEGDGPCPGTGRPFEVGAVNRRLWRGLRRR
jgi:hypothetical protein